MNLTPILAALATSTPLAESTRALFEQLGYPTDRQQELDEPTWPEFESAYVLDRALGAGFDRDKARVTEWAEVDLAFQLVQADLTGALKQDRSQLGITFEEKRQVDVREVKAWLVFSLRLTGTSYSRAELAALTREINRLFRGPALVLITYGPGKAALAVIHRRLNKQDDSRDVLEKVSLLKDIDLGKPNRAHLDILADLSLTVLKGQHPSMQTFADLYRAWHQTLDTQALNNRFYRELRNWYYWAVEAVEFPSDAEPDRATRNATGVIRLITRVMFCWFLKEKGLIAPEVFDEDTFRALIDPTRDASGSAYYRGILQNLFFATLNTEMEKDFVAPADKPGEKSRLFKPATVRNIDPNRGDKTYYRYANLFKDFDKTTGDAPAGVALFRNIPHLNGGLFECLDERSGGAGAKNSISKAVDCFTTDKKHYGNLSVPNELFFGESHLEDLSANYDDKEKTKHRRDAVRGLIPLLNRYKFTVEENTPLEEEVALDPELLGRVFESLLATYNPETRQTARKQTGSFYTPREIVAYMVDESLIRYLADKLVPPAPQRGNGRAGSKSQGAALVQTQDKLAENLFGETKPKQASLGMVPAKLLAKEGVAEALDSVAGETDLENRLRKLMGHGPLVSAPHPEYAAEAADTTSEEGPLFTVEETRVLIKALAQARILDPACGSGAFPMGALQQLTNILSRLDPNNYYWREALAEQVQLKVRGTFRIEDAQVRARQLTDLNEVFERHTGSDYGRKLYLIQQALYGVDIQPIAVQITKLRFFISLVVEQAPDNTQPNRGIRALPNLETKFVAANSLVRLARPAQLVIQNPAIDTLKEQLLEARRQHFLARRDQKRTLRTEDKRLRTEISKLLKLDGWNPTEADQVAAWNPYDQNAHAGFFDPEWMFGIGADQGFDLVLGNPPYVRHEKFTDFKPSLQRDYPNTYTGTADLYVYFYDRALQSLRPGGLLCFITSNKFYRAAYGSKLRGMLASSTTLLRLIDFGDAPVFEAIAYPTIILTQKTKPTANHTSLTMVWQPGPDIANFPALFAENAFNLPQKTLTAGSWQFEEAATRALMNKLRSAGKPLGEYVNGRFYYGIKTGLNEAFVVDANTCRDLIKADKRSAELLKPYLRGRDIKRWRVNDTGLWLIFTRRGTDIDKYPAIKRHLAQFQHQLTPGISGGRKPGSYKWFDIQDNIAYWQEFEQPKIIIPAITKGASYALDTTGFYTNDKTSICVADNPMYLLGLLNSRLLEWQIEQTAATKQGGFLEFKPMYVTQLPIMKAPKKQEQEIEQLVAKILAAKAANSETSTLGMEERVNEIVYELYGLTEEEIALVKGHSETVTTTA